MLFLWLLWEFIWIEFNMYLIPIICKSYLGGGVRSKEKMKNCFLDWHPPVDYKSNDPQIHSSSLRVQGPSNVTVFFSCMFCWTPHSPRSAQAQSWDMEIFWLANPFSFYHFFPSRICWREWRTEYYLLLTPPYPISFFPFRINAAAPWTFLKQVFRHVFRYNDHFWNLDSLEGSWDNCLKR